MAQKRNRVKFYRRLRRKLKPSRSTHYNRWLAASLGVSVRLCIAIFLESPYV